jgi:hypothetical protein
MRTIAIALSLAFAALQARADGLKKDAKALERDAASAAHSVDSTAGSVGYAAESITQASLDGYDHFDSGVTVEHLWTKKLLAQCPNIPAPNGCSVPLSDKISDKFKTIFRPACDDHDICYTTSIDKTACDVQFHRRMLSICKTLSDTKTLGLCSTTAGTWFAAVAHSSTGLQHYTAARAWAKSNCKPMPAMGQGHIIKAKK